MKYLKNKSAIKTLFFIGIFSSFVSCRKSDFTNANINPNAPETVVPANILPAVENGIAYSQGGDIARFAGMFVQQAVGFSRQAAAYYSYVLTSTDFDTPWGNLYTSGLGNDNDLLKKADAGGYNRYSGIARVLMAYNLQLLVDSWGKIPYSQALKGSSNTHPVYDDDKALYDTIINLLDVAIVNLNDPSPGGQVPGSDDLIYGGSKSNWIKFAHAIKARIYIHQSKNNAAMAQKALDEANLSFTSNDDNAQYLYGNAETNGNPIYQFNEQRADIDYGAGVFVDTLTALGDPRLGLTADPTYSDVNGVGVGAYYGNINGHVEFITYEEIEFIKAEATLRISGDYATAQGYYTAGIQASLDKLGVSSADAATYITANGTLPTTSAADAIAAVSLQEYISLYMNPEAWTLWRRTGAPALTPTAGTNGIPRRFLYPQNEYSLNGSNVPSNATLFSPKVFWDN